MKLKTYWSNKRKTRFFNSLADEIFKIKARLCTYEFAGTAAIVDDVLCSQQ